MLTSSPGGARHLEPAMTRKTTRQLPAPYAPGSRGQLMTSESVCLFAFAGRATLTVESARTGARFTYRLEEGDKAGFHFVKVMSGSDNESDYQYLGHYRDTNYTHGRKSRISPDAPSAVAFAFLAQALRRPGALPSQLLVWHEGRCGACNRKLTVPESIMTGLGPECRSRVDTSIVCEDLGDRIAA